METKTADQIINAIAEALAQSDGKYIERIANQILTNTVKYVGDSTFEVETENDDSFDSDGNYKRDQIN